LVQRARKDVDLANGGRAKVVGKGEVEHALKPDVLDGEEVPVNLHGRILLPHVKVDAPYECAREAMSDDEEDTLRESPGNSHGAKTYLARFQCYAAALVP